MLSCTIVGRTQNMINYWFDQQTERAAYTSGDIDCSALATGVHFVHFQIKGTDGMEGPVQSKAFIVLNKNTEPSYCSAIYYWFDQQKERAAYTSGDIDCSALATGVHFVHFQIKGTDGMEGPVQSKAFIVLNKNTEPSYCSAIYYWFDQQKEKKAYTNGSIDCSALSTGVHFVHFQIKGDDGKMSPVQSKAFILMKENTESPTCSAINYWFDQQTEKTAYTSGDIDCSALSFGLHALHFQLIDSSNKPGPVQTRLFIHLDSETPKLCYWFDNDSTRYITTTDNTEINVEGLSYSHHTIHAMLVDGKGHAVGTEVMTAEFIVVGPEGQLGDSNNDRIVDVADITTTAAYILGKNPDPFIFGNADVDQDGQITVSDITGTATIILINAKRELELKMKK